MITKLPLKRGHLSNQDSWTCPPIDIHCPEGVHYRACPYAVLLLTTHCYLCVCSVPSPRRLVRSVGVSLSTSEVARSALRKRHVVCSDNPARYWRKGSVH